MNRMHLQDRYRDVAWAMEQFTEAEYAYVAANGEDGTPYNIPLCVVRVGDALYFHTALEGLAVDLFRRDGRVCVSCTTYTLRDPEHTTLLFRSAMAFGTVSEVTQPDEKKEIMIRYFEKYLPGDPKAEAYAVRASARAAVWRISIREAVGKENKAE
jgi:nitroimidazol reductase NimA-like FMN-containing flavoprotein (pyridoxamine 5'-phosphate oxidase superfamily)